MKKETRSKIKKETLDWLSAIIYAVIFGTIIRLFVFETMMVPTPSMVPTIIEKDRLFVEKITYSYQEPQIGDIVVFWTPFEDKMAQQMLRSFDRFMDFFAPSEFNGHVKYVKRLVAKSGDVIRLKTLTEDQWKYIIDNEENIPLWLNNLIKDYDYNVNLIPSRIKNRISKIEVNGSTPFILNNQYYIKNAIFDDTKFFDYLAHPNDYRSEIINSEMFFVYKDNFTGQPMLEKPRIEWFRAYNQVIAYNDYYDKHLSHLNKNDYIYFDSEGFINLKIPEGYYFFLGDNSLESFDSRFFGFVPEENIIGTTFLRITPFDRFGRVN